MPSLNTLIRLETRKGGGGGVGLGFGPLCLDWTNQITLSRVLEVQIWWPVLFRERVHIG